MRTLWLEPSGGLAGDMLLAALLDLGDPRFDLAVLEDLVRRLVPGEASLAVEPVRRGAFAALRLDVRTAESAAPPERHLAELLALLERADLPPGVAGRAAAVLRRIAVAEARVHAIDVDEVHFHEIGAVDTLVDVAGAVLALERLAVERVVSAPPYVGGGTVRCAHGEVAVPAPGTAELLRGLPHAAGPGGERLTPTGAALLAELVDSFEPRGARVVEALGYGAGAREPAEGPPNLVRVQLGRSLPGPESAEVPDLEAGLPAGARTTSVHGVEFNLDDATGEEIAFLLERLRAAGALDAWTVPCQMKKGRPGVVVTLLCRAADLPRVRAEAFRHSPTLGLRTRAWERVECARDEIVVRLEGREVRVRRRLGVTDDAHALSPEFEDLAALARASGRGLRELAERAIEAARRAQPPAG